MPAWILTEGDDNFPAGGPPPPNDWKNIGSDQIFGLGGDDIINAGALADTVQAGEGDDEVNGGDDLDILLGNNGDDEMNGDDGDDSLSGENGVDILHGNDGDDSISGGADGDMIFGDIGADLLDGNDGNDTIEGGTGNDTIYTGSGSDTARGGDGADIFGIVSDSAAAGDVDQLFGDAGNDLLITKGFPADGWTASFNGGSGTDTVRASGDIRHYSFLSAEVLQNTNAITATAAQLNQFSLFVDSNPFNDFVIFNITTAGTVDFSARLDASVTKLFVTGSIDGNTLIGGGGDDTLLTYSIPFGGGPGPAAVRLEGRGGNDTLEGGNGDDYLDGGAGADFMGGNGGNNIYIVDNAGDSVGAGGPGVDEVRTTLNAYDASLLFGGHFLDRIVFTGAGNFNGVLRASGGTIVGGAGDDTLTGVSGGIFDGNQTFIGGGGNDTITGANNNPDTADYSTATSAVSVSLAILGAQNTGASTGSDTLAGIENLTGSIFSDTLTGDAGNNILNGGAGANLLTGGGGDDTYIFTASANTIVETAGGGSNDHIRAGASFTLQAGHDIERLSTIDAAALTAINLTGNDLAQVITGNAGSNTLTGLGGNDTLDGGGGADVLNGGLGNDIYLVNAAGGTTGEAAGQGTDTVRTSLASYTLQANVEWLYYTGAGNFTAKGNALANKLFGAAGSDTFTADGAGADAFGGFDGLDTVDYRALAGATINFLTNVHGGSAAGHSFNSIERIFGSIAGADTITGGNREAIYSGFGGNDILRGGSKADTLNGNDGNDTLIGNGEADTIEGGRDNDVMTGNAATDFFVFRETFASGGIGQDRVTDFTEGVDRLKFGAATANALSDFTITGQGTTQVVMTVIGGSVDTITLQSTAAITITAGDVVFF